MILTLNWTVPPLFRFTGTKDFFFSFHNSFAFLYSTPRTKVTETVYFFLWEWCRIAWKLWAEPTELTDTRTQESLQNNSSCLVLVASKPVTHKALRIERGRPHYQSEPSHRQTRRLEEKGPVVITHRERSVLTSIRDFLKIGWGDGIPWPPTNFFETQPCADPCVVLPWP